MRHSKLYSLFENVIFCTNNREQKVNLTEKNRLWYNFASILKKWNYSITTKFFKKNTAFTNEKS